MKMLGYYNGKVGELEEMSVHMTDRVCFFGDGIYDATYSKNYIVFTLEEHMDRFYRSAEALRIDIPHTKQELSDILKDLLSKMDTGENFVYWQATRGTAVRNHAFPENGKANIWITITPKNIVDTYKKVRLITAEDTRFLHCNIKTLNLLPAVMASQKAKEMGCEETVFHRGGRVTECAHSNVHIIKDGAFRTAQTDNLILAGIARQHLINACWRLGIPVVEEAFSLEDMMNADEILISSAGSLGLAASEIDGIPVGGKAPELLKRLQDEVQREFDLATTK